MKKRVMRGDIVVNRPLDYDVRDSNDNLLLKKDHVIAKQSQIDVLVDRGVYFSSSSFLDRHVELPQAVVDIVGSSPSRSSFELIEQAYSELDTFLNSMNTSKHLGIISRVSRLIQQACEQDKDASISTILWPHEIRYPVKHQVDTAIVCENVLKTMQYAPQERQPVLAAALTMNIAIIDLQDVLFYQKEELSKAQKEEIHSHPFQGVETLRTFGATDRTWLDAVMQQHEFLDGSGYPQGIKGDEICEAASILTIGDIYCAKLVGRGYRSPLPPHKAIRELYCGERGHAIDPALARYFAGEFGMYPPGSVVRLVNGDIAVVIRNGARIDEPIACSIIRPDGTVYLNPRERDCSQGEFAVKDALPEWQKSGINRYRLWGIGSAA